MLKRRLIIRQLFTDKEAMLKRLSTGRLLDFKLLLSDGLRQLVY